MRKLYLSLSILPLWSLGILNIGWWCFMPIAEDKIALSSIPIFYRCHIISISLSLSPRTNAPLHTPPPPTIRFDPFPIPFFFQLLLLARKIQTHLFPQLILNPWAWPLFCLQTNVKNRSRRNVLCNRIMVPEYVSLHHFQSHLPQEYSSGGGNTIYRQSTWCCIPASLLITLWRKLPRRLSICGVTTPVSAPNNRTAWITAGYKWYEVPGSILSLPKSFTGKTRYYAPSIG